MVALEYHPAFKIQPLQPAADTSRVLLSINTDNPITFATSLADEFAYVYFAMLQNRSATAHEALEWLERRRGDGWHSRFTVAASTRPDVLAHIGRAPIQ